MQARIKISSPLTGMADVPPMKIEFTLPAPLIELLAIRLGYQRTIAKSLVISPPLSQRARGARSDKTPSHSTKPSQNTGQVAGYRYASFALSGALFAVLLLSLSLVRAASANDWDLKDKDGAHHTLSELRGKWVLVNFWAPWCPSCIHEISDLATLQQQHKDLQIIGVAVMYKSRKEVMDMLGKQAISYPTVLGNEDTAGDFGGLDGLPTSFLYSPSGELLGHHQGPLTQEEIEQAIEQKPEAAALFTR